MILEALAWKAVEGGHNIETLLLEFRERHLLFFGMPKPWMTWREIEIRQEVIRLLKGGRITVNSAGILTPSAQPDPEIERFEGSWYVTLNGQIRGPLSEVDAKCLLQKERSTR